MKKNLLLLSLAAIVSVSANTYSAEEIKVEVKVSKLQDIKTKAKKAALYAAPFLLTNLVHQAIQDMGCDLNKKDFFVRRAAITGPLLIGAFAMYFWPKASEIK